MVGYVTCVAAARGPTQLQHTARSGSMYACTSKQLHPCEVACHLRFASSYRMMSFVGTHATVCWQVWTVYMHDVCYQAAETDAGMRLGACVCMSTHALLLSAADWQPVMYDLRFVDVSEVCHFIFRIAHRIRSSAALILAACSPAKLQADGLQAVESACKHSFIHMPTAKQLGSFVQNPVSMWL